MDHPEIKDGNLLLPTGPVPVPPGLLTSKAFTKSGIIDGRSHAGKALRGWVQEQVAATMAREAPQEPQDSQFAPEGVDHPSEAPAALSGPPEPVPAFGLPGGHTETPAPVAPDIPETPAEQPAPSFWPRLGSHEASKHLVETLAAAYPDAKPSDWRAVQAMLQNAMRYGQTWGNLQRK